ncbi:hypothetical protein V496_03931 [Pseudogymnoascus sp. VKM F-4515 (FW-2607)]|nr:hypothetical protein V496_03931 [Pseudogymnoascus sp. VKM F-4515 (FW-2607)]
MSPAPDVATAREVETAPSSTTGGVVGGENHARRQQQQQQQNQTNHEYNLRVYKTSIHRHSAPHTFTSST